MFSRIPEKRADRIAIAKVLATGFVGSVLLVWLLASSLVAMPDGALDASHGEMGQALALWGIDVEHLLLVMPVGALVVLYARVVIGLAAFGIFTPMLMALAFLQLGPLFGPLLMGGAILIGRLVAPWLDRLHLSRIGIMTILIGVVVLLIYAAQDHLFGPISGTAFPVVVTALVIERWWISQQADGPVAASQMMLSTILVAIGVELILVAPPLKWAVATMPYAVPVIAIALSLFVARYRGLRLTELHRFEPILEEPNERSWNESPKPRNRAA